MLGMLRSNQIRVLALVLMTVSLLTPVAVLAAPYTDELAGRTVFEDHGDIYVRDASGTKQLTNDGKSHSPVWSRDGEWIAFVSERYGEIDIYLMHPDGSEVTPVTKDALEEMLPAFSRAGDVYFVRRIETNDGIVNQVVRHILSEAEERVLYEEPGGLCFPSYLSISPNGDPALSLSCGRGKFVFLIDAETRTSKSLDELGISELVGCAIVGVWAHNEPLLAVIAQPECQGEAGQYALVLDFGSSSQGVVSVTHIDSKTAVTDVSWSDTDELILNGGALSGPVPGMPTTGVSDGTIWLAWVTGALLALSLGVSLRFGVKKNVVIT
jgi:hypothetical protein